MRAAYYETNGSAREVLRVGEIETPKPAPGELRVKLRTSGVNPSDVKSRAGATRKIAFPRVVPHSDGAGEVDAVGDGVPQSRIGEKVWIWNGQWKRAYGSAAEYIVLPAQQAVKLPPNASFDDGACLGIPAMTASHAVALAGATKGTTILVAGGAGAVGQYAIQFAKAEGATVITTVSSEQKAALARKLGADHVIDYKRENVGESVMAVTANKGADTIIEVDLSANARLIPAVLRPSGSVIVYGTGPDVQLPALFCLVNQIRLQFMLIYDITAQERTRAVSAITRLLEAGRLTNLVAQKFPLADIVKAHEAVEQGKAVGNIVIEMD